MKKRSSGTRINHYDKSNFCWYEHVAQQLEPNFEGKIEILQNDIAYNDQVTTKEEAKWQHKSWRPQTNKWPYRLSNFLKLKRLTNLCKDRIFGYINYIEKSSIHK